MSRPKIAMDHRIPIYDLAIDEDWDALTNSNIN